MNIADGDVQHMYEVLNLTEDQIAEETGFDVAAVKASLEQNSHVFRQRAKLSEKPFIDKSTRELLRMSAIGLALSAENEGVRAKMVTYLLEEDAGRNEARVMKKNAAPINIMFIQQAIMQAKEQLKDTASMFALPEPETKEAVCV